MIKALLTMYCDGCGKEMTRAEIFATTAKLLEAYGTLKRSSGEPVHLVAKAPLQHVCDECRAVIEFSCGGAGREPVLY